MSDWKEQLQEGLPVIRQHYVLFIIVFSLGAIGSYFVTDKLYEQSLIAKDSTIQSQEISITNKDTKISDLKDSKEKLERELEDGKVIIKSKEVEIKKLEEQITTLKESKQKKTVLTPKQIESKIRNWLIDSSHTVSKVQDEKTYFRFDIESKKSRKFATIKLNKSQEKLLYLQVGMGITNEEQGIINKLGKQMKL